MRQRERRFQAEVFPALLFIVLAPILAIRLGGVYQCPIMVGNLALFAATLRWRCLDCGERGSLLFPQRHKCDALRPRPGAGAPPPVPDTARPGSVLSWVVALMVLATVVMCAYLIATEWPGS